MSRFNSLLLFRLVAVALMVGGFLVGAWGAAAMDRLQLVIALVLGIISLLFLQWAEYVERQGMIAQQGTPFNPWATPQQQPCDCGDCGYCGYGEEFSEAWGNK